jgi:hypothetical protein
MINTRSWSVERRLGRARAPARLAPHVCGQDPQRPVWVARVLLRTSVCTLTRISARGCEVLVISDETLHAQVPYMEQIMPKKAEIQVAKCEGKINVVCIEKVPGQILRMHARAHDVCDACTSHAKSSSMCGSRAHSHTHMHTQALHTRTHTCTHTRTHARTHTRAIARTRAGTHSFLQRARRAVLSDATHSSPIPILHAYHAR